MPHQDTLTDRRRAPDPEDGSAQAGSELPPRPRRRLVTPWSAGLATVILVALGFIGGVLVQKGHQDSGASRLAAAATVGAGSGPGRRQRQAGQAQGDGASSPIAGEVDSVDGTTIYVTGADGTTVKVLTKSSSKVTRNAKSRVHSIHPGDTVVVTGSTASSGTVTATRINATAGGVTSVGIGGFGGRAAGAGRPGGSQGGDPVTPPGG